jgi:hypothetical protein
MKSIIAGRTIGTVASNVSSGASFGSINKSTAVVVPGLSCPPVASLATVAVGTLFFFAIASSFSVSFVTFVLFDY